MPRIIASNVSSVLSSLHFRVFLKGFMLAVAECYDIIFPWLNLLEDTHKVGIETHIKGFLLGASG